MNYESGRQNADYRVYYEYNELRAARHLDGASDMMLGLLAALPGHCFPSGTIRSVCASHASVNTLIGCVTFQHTLSMPRKNDLFLHTQFGLSRLGCAAVLQRHDDLLSR
jgi:hypothetical protein